MLNNILLYVININNIKVQMSAEEEDQKDKIIEEPRIVQPVRKQSTVRESKHAQQYLQLMNTKGKTPTYNQLIQKLANKQIKTHETPSQKQLQIISVNTSKNYEIIDLQVKVGLYSMNIHIINNQGQSPIHNQSWIAEGTFGKIYKYTSDCGQNRAVKCIQIKKNVLFEEQIFKAIHEYALLKIASAVESGPSVSFQNFDIVCYRKSKIPLKKHGIDSEQYACCIQFEMELCEPSKIINPQQIQPLYHSLFNLHILRCSHNDIKPDNILFSPTFQKWVYLDYGVSSCNKQKIGQCSFAYFRGTLQYSIPEVAKLLSRGPDFVDLYWNDVHGLQLTLKVLKKPRKEALLVKVQTDEKIDIYSHYLLLRLKFYLYYYNFPAIQNLGLKIKWEKTQKKCLFYFILQMQFIPEELKIFLGNLIQDWSDIETIQFINPKQIFGVVTSSLQFRNFKALKIKAIQQKSKIFKQIASLLIDEFNKGKSENNLNKALFKKQYKQWLKILQNEAQARQLDENNYIVILFEFVDFVKSGMTIPLKKKSSICKIFQKIKTQQDTSQKQLYKQPISDQINEFSFEAIKFFMDYLIKMFIEKSDPLLFDLFPRLYIDYLILGLAQTQTIKSIYQAIINKNWPLKTQIQYFNFVVKNKFWYENVIFMKEPIDVFEINKIEFKILKKLYKATNLRSLIKDEDQHSCSQEQICHDLEKAMFKVLREYNELKNKIDNFDNRLNNYSQILQKLNKNLMYINSENNYKMQLANKIKMQVQSNRTLGENLGKIRFSQSEIPLNLCQLYTSQLFSINSLSYCYAAEHLQQILNYDQITQFWVIVIVKNLLKFQQQDDKSTIINYFSSIKQIYSSLPRKSLSVAYMFCFHKIRSYFKKQFVKQITNFELLQLITDQLQLTNKLIADQFTEEQLAQFLVSLNEDNAIAIWRYMRLISKQHRFVKISELFLSKISSLSCKVRSQVKRLAFTIFKNLYESTEFCLKNQKRRNLNTIVFAENGTWQIQYLKLYFIQYCITQLAKQQQYIERTLQLSQYFEQLTKILKTQDYQQYFLTQKLTYNVFCLYFISIIRKKQFQKAFEFVEKLCNRILSYISKQTYFLLFRFKAYLFNYYITIFKYFLHEWPQFRNQYLKISRKKKQSALDLLNINFVYIDLNYQSIYKLNYMRRPTRISYRDMVILLYKGLKILDLINLSYKWHQIDCYYRCWLMLFQTEFECQQRLFVKTRFLNFITKRHKKAIEIQLKQNQRNKQDELYYFGMKNKIKILIHMSRAEIRYRGLNPLVYVQRFKQKIDKFYSEQVLNENTSIKFTK